MTRRWTVPGYTEIRELGRGATGIVVLAQHAATGRAVAVKYLFDELHARSDVRDDFRGEAETLATIDDPHVVRLWEYVESGESAAIVMELVDGVTLREVLAQHGPTQPESALAVLRGSLLGLGAAHRLGVVHRDYKPENVLVTPDGDSKLTDFGIAAVTDGVLASAGTPSYLAPEQWADAPATPRGDIYAATAGFVECLLGRAPFVAADLAMLRRQHEQAPIPVGEVPEPVRDLVRRGLAKSPDDRPADAGVFLAELEAAALAGYGQDWEERGRRRLAERAALLALLFPLATGVVGGTAVATTVLGSAGGTGARSVVSRFRSRALLGAAAALVIVGGTVIAVHTAGSATDVAHSPLGLAGPGSAVGSGAPRVGSPLIPGGPGRGPATDISAAGPVGSAALIAAPPFGPAAPVAGTGGGSGVGTAVGDSGGLGALGRTAPPAGGAGGGAGTPPVGAGTSGGATGGGATGGGTTGGGTTGGGTTGGGTTGGGTTAPPPTAATSPCEFFSEPVPTDNGIECKNADVPYDPSATAVALCYTPGYVPARNTGADADDYPYFCVNGASAPMYPPFHVDDPSSTDPDPNPNMQCDDGMALVRNSSSDLVCTDLVPPLSTPGGGCPDGSFSDAGGDVCYADPDKPTPGTTGPGTTGTGTTGTGTTGTSTTGTSTTGTSTTGTSTDPTGTGTTATGTTCPSGQIPDPLSPGACVPTGIPTSPCVDNPNTRACDPPPVVRIVALPALPAQPTTTTTTGAPPNEPTTSTKAATTSKGTSTRGTSGGHEKSGSKKSSTDKTVSKPTGPTTPTKKQPVTTKASSSAEDAEKSVGAQR